MLPEAFLERMKHQLGAEYPAYIESLERPRAVALRLNPLKGELPDLPFVKAPVPWEPLGYYYDETARPGLNPLHEAGVYYLQEASAMSAVALLEPQPGERICDLCAAPGGKATQIAGRMQGQGLLLCNELSPKRAKILSRNIERMGVCNALVTNEHPERLAERLPEFFDRVLIDAPCSGEGMFRKEEAAVADWSQETVEMCARRQAEILHSGAMLVKPGGRLVYSTCTFSPEENEETVRAFLQSHPAFSPEATDAPWFTPGENGSYRLWPHKLLGEGHFVAVLRRAGEPEENRISGEKEEKCPRSWEEFAKELNLRLPGGSIRSFGRALYWMPAGSPDLRGLRVLRPGLELGEDRQGRFVPAHALALSLRSAPNMLELAPDSPEIAKYLHGDVIPCGVPGWCLVTVGGYSVGWGKSDGKILKNHYPKGLRR